MGIDEVLTQGGEYEEEVVGGVFLDVTVQPHGVAQRVVEDARLLEDGVPVFYHRNGAETESVPQGFIGVVYQSHCPWLGQLLCSRFDPCCLANYGELGVLRVSWVLLAHVVILDLPLAAARDAGPLVQLDGLRCGCDSRVVGGALVLALGGALFIALGLEGHLSGDGHDEACLDGAVVVGQLGNRILAFVIICTRSK